MARERKATGQITFRCPVEVHEELLEIAGVLGLDMNGLLTLMIKESLPVFLKRATEQAKQHEEVRKQFDAVVAVLPGGDSPLVVEAVAAGRGKQGMERVGAMIAAVGPKHKPSDGLLASILAAALDRLQKEDELLQMEQAVQGYYETEGRELPEGTVTPAHRGDDGGKSSGRTKRKKA